jgi:hypothetical protein
MALSRILRKVLVFVAFAFLLITIAVGGFLHFNPLCEEELGIEKTSPDGLYVAQFMTRNCGATTPYVGHINLRSATSKFSRNFLDGVITDGEVYASSKYSASRFCWSKAHKLSIGYPDLPLHSWRDVTIDDDFRNPECQ